MEELTRLVVNIAKDLRSMGVNVSIAEIIDAINIVHAYCTINNIDYRSLDKEDLKFILKSVLVKRDIIEGYFEKSWRKNIVDKDTAVLRMSEQIERRLRMLGLMYGIRFSSIRKIINRAKTKKEKRIFEETLATLQRIGIIRRRRRGYYTVDESTARKIVVELVNKGYMSLTEAGKSIAVDLLRKTPQYKLSKDIDIYVRGGLDQNGLSQVSTPKLLELGYYALKKGDKRSLKGIIDELKNRNLLDDITNKHIEFLHSAGLLTDKNIINILRSKPRLARNIANKVGTSKLVNLILNNMNDRDLGDILPYIVDYISEETLEKLVLKIPLTDLYKLPRGILSRIKDKNLREDLKVAIDVSKAFNYITRSWDKTSGQAYEYYAEYLLSKALQSKPTTNIGYKALVFAKKLVDVLSSNGRYEAGIESLIRVLGNVEFLEAWNLLRRLYGTLDSTGKSWIKHVAYRLWIKQITRIKSHVYKGWHKSIVNGRIDLRPTILNIIRLKNRPLVYKRRLELKDVNLVADISGSMNKYSTWVLLTASAFLRNVKRITLFHSDVFIIDVRGRRDFDKLIDYLLALQFHGYTNIVKALKETVKGAAVRRLILISDLKQTIRTDESIVEVLLELTSKGWSIAIIAPVSVDENIVHTLRENGLPVYIVENPLKTPTIFYHVWKNLQ